MQKNFELLLQIWPKDFPAIEYVKLVWGMGSASTRSHSSN
jgi:hypothetical protein